MTSIQQRDSIPVATRAPVQIEKVWLLTQCFQVGEKKQAAAAFQGTARFAHGSQSRRIGCHGQHTETMNVQMSAVNVLRPSCFIGQEFPIKTALAEIDTLNRHGAAVCFKKKPRLFADEFQSEH